jgi:uncharacterized protein
MFLALTTSPTVTGGVVVAVASAAFLIGLSKGGLNGLGPIITLVVAISLPTKIAVGLLLPLLMIGDVTALWAHWGRWDRAAVKALLPGAVGGVALASFFLGSISERLFEWFLIAISFGFAAYRLLEPRLRKAPLDLRPRHGVAAGVVAGVTSTIAHVGGPPVSIYLLARRVEPRPFVASSVLVFAVVNWTKVPAFVASGFFDTRLMATLWPVVALIPPGVLAGRWIVTRLSQKVFDGIVLGSLVVGAALLLT